VEGSAPGVPRDEVGLGEQWELLLLLQELWVLEPVMRWTTGFWAKSTPTRHREAKRRVTGTMGMGYGAKSSLSNPKDLIPNRKRLSARQGGLETDQRVSDNQGVRRDPQGLGSGGLCHRDVLLMEHGKIPTGFNPLGGEKQLPLHRSARPPARALSRDARVRPADMKRLEQSTGDNNPCFPKTCEEQLSKAARQRETRDNAPSS